MKIYGHDKTKALEASEGKPTTLVYPSGKNHVLLPNRQHVNPAKFRGTKKERLKQRALAKRFQPVSMMPLGMMPPAPAAEPEQRKLLPAVAPEPARGPAGGSA